MAFIIIGALMVLAGAGLYFGSQGQKKKLGEMKATETSTAAALADTAGSIAKEIGPGSFNQIAEVKGTIECDAPLQSELSQTDCIHYSMKVTREYEETYWETDDKGNRQQKTRRGAETVADNTRSVAFFVRDSTGRIAVDPTGAALDTEKVFSEFKPGENHGPGFQFGRYSFNASAFAALAGGRRTLGYRFEESATPVGRTVYVLGEAVDNDGRLRIRKPDKKGATFIISLKSEEQLVQGAQSSAKGMLIAAIIIAALGAAGIIVGIVRSV